VSSLPPVCAFFKGLGKLNFVPMLQVTEAHNEAHNDEEFGFSSLCIFLFKKDMTMRILAPHCCVFFGSSVASPQGHDDEELGSSSSCIFLF